MTASIAILLPAIVSIIRFFDRNKRSLVFHLSNFLLVVSIALFFSLIFTNPSKLPTNIYQRLIADPIQINTATIIASLLILSYSLYAQIKNQTEKLIEPFSLALLIAANIILLNTNNLVVITACFFAISAANATEETKMSHIQFLPKITDYAFLAFSMYSHSRIGTYDLNHALKEPRN